MKVREIIRRIGLPKILTANEENSDVAKMPSVLQASVEPRKGVLNSLKLLAGYVGELSFPTDVAAIVQHTGVPGESRVYYQGSHEIRLQYDIMTLSDGPVIEHAFRNGFPVHICFHDSSGGTSGETASEITSIDLDLDALCSYTEFAGKVFTVSNVTLATVNVNCGDGDYFSLESGFAIQFTMMPYNINYLTDVSRMSCVPRITSAPIPVPQ